MGLVKEVLDKASAKLWGRTLYFPGCTTRHIDQTHNKTISKNYESILRKLDLNFTTLKMDFCCGSKLLETGHGEDFETHIKQKLKLLKKFNITKIITNCPHCAITFKKEYGIETTHVLDEIIKNVDKLPVNQRLGKEISYHDSCIIARQLNIKEGPRKILSALGFKIKEMEDNRNLTLCCGAGGSLNTSDFFLSKKIADRRLKQCETTSLVVSCPLCYHHFKDISKEKEILDFSEAIL